METQTGHEILGFQTYFELQHNYDGRAFSFTRRSQLLLEAECRQKN